MNVQDGREKNVKAASFPHIVILLVNWNARRYTLECLSSLQQVNYPLFEVVVVDNASSDGSVDAIVAAHPEVTQLRLSDNRGFTGANNVGFRYALDHGADFVYLLNTDTRVAPDFLARAVTTALSDPTIGIVGSKVLFAQHPKTLQFMGGRVNLRTGYNGRPFGHGQRDNGQYDQIQDVDWVTGCALMVSRACLDTIGGLDEHFFAFHEDVDLSLRARAAGFRVVMSPQSCVWHEGGGSLQGTASTTHMYYSVRNALYLVHKHRPGEHYVIASARTACIIGAHIVQALLNGSASRAIKTIMAGHRDYTQGVTGPRPPISSLSAVQDCASRASSKT